MAENANQPVPLSEGNILLNRVDVAGILGVSTNELSRMHQSGKAPPTVPVNSWGAKYRLSDLRVWMRRHKWAARQRIEQNQKKFEETFENESE